MPNEELQISRLTLSELRERLQERDIEIGLSTLSELIKDGDIAEQLGAKRKGNKLLFPLEALDILAAFIPEFRANPKFTNQARPEALRSFLQKGAGSIAHAGTELSEFRGNAQTALLSDIRGILQQKRPDLADEVYTAQEAAAFLRCSVATLKRRVPCSFRLGRSPRWYKSDLLRLGKINS